MMVEITGTTLESVHHWKNRGNSAGEVFTGFSFPLCFSLAGGFVAVGRWLVGQDTAPVAPGAGEGESVQPSD